MEVESITTVIDNLLKCIAIGSNTRLQHSSIKSPDNKFSQQQIKDYKVITQHARAGNRTLFLVCLLIILQDNYQSNSYQILHTFVRRTTFKLAKTSAGGGGCCAWLHLFLSVVILVLTYEIQIRIKWPMNFLTWGTIWIYILKITRPSRITSNCVTLTIFSDCEWTVYY